MASSSDHGYSHRAIIESRALTIKSICAESSALSAQGYLAIPYIILYTVKHFRTVGCRHKHFTSQFGKDNISPIISGRSIEPII